jgi:hypothetical protein
MAAMIGKHHVSLAELPSEGECAELLAHAGMHRAVDLSFGKEAQKCRLHFADQHRFGERVGWWQ